MNVTIPIPGRLLVGQMAAYGLAAALDSAGEEAFIGHEDSLELRAQLVTPASIERIAEVIRETAETTKWAIDRNLPSSGTGPKEQVAIWARGTGMDRATEALKERERILDALHDPLATELVAALGSPACWLGERPDRGATRLDGVMGNATSDFVRGVLRRVRDAGAAVDAQQLTELFGCEPMPSDDQDRTGWAPNGTRLHALWQWLATLGLTLFPVGLSSAGPARTPCHNNLRKDDAAITLPVLAHPVSVPRLRAILQAPELCATELSVRGAGRLRALGVSELLRFAVEDRSTPQSVAFTFRPGQLVPLAHELLGAAT